MIFVKQDITLIPETVLEVAKKAQKDLEALPAEKRAEFIRRNSKVWGTFKEYLLQMSGQKCWYSESKEVQSFFDVDHFRPKLEAIRSANEKDAGYEWLAFKWENFRVSAQRSNRLSTNEETEETEGKGSWFPLLEGSSKATWSNRCEREERPVLLDPTVRTDLDLIEIDDNGRIIPSKLCIGSQKRNRVNKSIELYGLNLPNLVGARKSVMREIDTLADQLMQLATENETNPDAEHLNRFDAQKMIDAIRGKTMYDSAYARAARAHVHRLGLAAFCAYPEDRYA